MCSSDLLACHGPAPQLGPVFAFEYGVDPGVHGKLDGLARGPSRGNDDHPAALVRSPAVHLRVEREVVVTGGMHGGKEPCCL